MSNIALVPEQGRRRLIRIGGAVAAGFGILALFGWALGLPFLASFGRDVIPMAPSTALLFVLYGIAALLRARLPLGRGAQRAGVAINSAGALVALLLLILSLLGIHPVIEHLGFAAVGTVGETPVGHMSPATALCFLLASLSFFGSLPSSSSRPWRAEAAWWTTRLLLATACLLFLAYLFGRPLFYAGPFIPPAVTTSIAFAFLGTALLALAGRQGSRAGPPERVPYRLVLVFVLFAAGIVTLGGFYFRSEGRHYHAEVEHQLSTVAELKTNELAQWRSERLGDASIFADNTSFSTLLQRVFDNPRDAEARAQLQVWLIKVQTHYPYDRISVLDTRGAERLALPEGRTPVSSVIARRVPEVLRAREVVFEDFYRNEHDQRVYLSVLVPILDERSRALGMLAFRIDPDTYLYPLLNRWPTPSQTAEMLLVRREGSDVLFLNELKFQKHTTLILRIPLTRQDAAAAKAVLGQEGIVEARDYRGVPVLAALRAVPGSPWFLVARLDATEVNAPLREQFLVIVCLIGSMLAFIAAVVGMLWREQRVRHFRKLYDLARESAWLHEVIARSLNEVYIVEPDTLRFRFANRGACRNIGYTQEELSGLTVFDIEPRLTEEVIHRRVQRLRTGELPVHVFETVLRRKDGSEYLVEVHLQLADAGAGTVLLAIANDITERKQVEEALRESEDRYRDLVQHSNDLICTHDLKGRILSVNPAAVGFTGYSEDELLTMNLRDLLLPEFHGQFENYLAEIQAKGTATGSMLVQTKSGEKRIWEYANSLRTRDNAAAIVRGTACDVTKRKRAEEALRQAEEKYRRIFEEAVIGIFQTTPDGRILSLNSEMSRLYGYDSPAELMASRTDIAHQGYVNPGERELFKRQVEEKGSVHNFEYQAYRKDGTKLWCRENARVVRDPSGAVLYYEGTVEDITERKILEEQLRQAQRLEAVGRLAGGVAHDFNNILGVIIGYSQLLEEPPGLTEVQNKRVKEIMKAAERAASITRQLLAFSRKQILQPKVLNLNALIADVSKLLRRLIGEDVELVISAGSDLGRVKSDPSQIEQIIMNLAVNARDAMPQGGKLVIETANADLDAGYAEGHPPVQPGRYVMLAVSDTGCGMDAETRTHIFEPFFTTKELGKGTGLGLSIVYGVVKQSNGYIWVYSEPGQGTTIKIYLPRVEESPEPIAPQRSEAALPGGAETILLVEDEESLRKMARVFLENKGYTILEAKNGQEAVEIARQYRGPIHLLLTDVIMPGMSGRELAEALAASRAGIKLLYMSGYTDELVTQQGILNPGMRLLEKPFTRDSLLGRVRAILDEGS
ncbi:MAG: PAS domain S-box protein [Acidobacteriia bacterium]|nr:PAS domain S-box protein [Terriglobia bacterium]